MQLLGKPLVFTQVLNKEETILEDLTLKLVCSVNKDNMKAVWFKDNMPLQIDDRSRIRQISTGSCHILEIQNACLQDSGMYSVKIENLTSTSKVNVEGNLNFCCNL